MALPLKVGGRPMEIMKLFLLLFLGFVLSVIFYASILVIKGVAVFDCGIRCMCEYQGGYYQEIPKINRDDMVCSIPLK
jgi:hypothetical protein